MMIIRYRTFALITISYLVVACSSPAPKTTSAPYTTPGQASAPRSRETDQQTANEIVLQAMGLLDTGYKFGGSNPDAGLDCSGMVSHVVQSVAGLRLPHSAAQIAGLTRPIPRGALQPGDLVFFNTLNRPYSHMGLYIGDGRFVHAPSSKGRVRIERLDSRYFATRFDGARTLAN